MSGETVVDGATVVHWQPDDRLDGPRCDPPDRSRGVFAMTRHRPNLTCPKCIALVDPQRAAREAGRARLTAMLDRVLAMAECGMCPDDGLQPVTSLRIYRYENGDFKVTWWCHGDEFGGKAGESNGTDAFLEALAEASA